MTPASFRPAKPADFIGAAQDAARAMEKKVTRLRDSGAGTLKTLFYGPAGVGKTALAITTARRLSGHELAVEHVNGKEVNVDAVRKWISELGAPSLFGDWQVKVVDELDLCSRDAQDLLLTYLDKLPERRAFIATSNLQLDLLQERFQSRLQQFKITNPTTAEVSRLLTRRFSIPKNTASRIAVGSGGNVRAALLDAESWLDVNT